MRCTSFSKYCLCCTDFHFERTGCLLPRKLLATFQDLSLFPSHPSVPSSPSFPFCFLTNKLFSGNIMITGHVQVFCGQTCLAILINII